MNSVAISLPTWKTVELVWARMQNIAGIYVYLAFANNRVSECWKGTAGA